MTYVTTDMVETVLTELYERRGCLRPADIVAEAQDPNHVLHPCFEWDNSKAAERWRLWQAGGLIRRVRIVQGDDLPSIRRFHPTSYVGRSPDGYIALEDIADDPHARELLLRRMESEWRSFQRRYGHLAEFWHLIEITEPGEATA